VLASPIVTQQAAADSSWAAAQSAGRRPRPRGRLLPAPGSLPPSRVPLRGAAAQIQRKLAVGSVEDPLEREADVAAERVMRMPASALCPDCEREDELKLRAAAGPTMQRRELPVPAASQDGSDTWESRAAALEGRGSALSPSVREYMEPRFGHDFGDVRVHTDANAAETARMVDARAFTLGRNVVFGEREFAPESSSEGRSLLAHELAHVVQQRRRPRRVQRRIVVGGKPYTPNASYYDYLTKNFGDAMKEFVARMDNGGNPPDYIFSSFDQMGNEVRVRAQAIKGIEEVHKGCCGYYSTAEPPYLDSTYWDQIGSAVDFKPKSPLPAGKQASDAIKAIFAPGAKTRVECFSMTVAIQYYSMMKGLGEARFNSMFPGGVGIEISQRARTDSQQPLLAGADKKYKNITVSSKTELLPGDWVYFKNFSDYTTRVPGGYWQGENAIYLGGGNYRGFGVASMSENDLNQELVNQYNNGASPRLSKTVADLIAGGGGLLLSPVLRPEISKLVP
jgi:hypothetical protein